MARAGMEMAGGGAIGIETLRGSAGRRRREGAIRWLFFSAAAFSIVVSLLIVTSLLDGTVDFLSKAPLSTLWNDTGWFPRRDLFDIKTILVGTLLVSFVAILIAGPIGLGAAIYLSEYARPRARKVLKPILEILAGIPSVVMGYFALTFISPSIIQTIAPTAPRFNLAAAGVGVGILIIPLMATIAEDALHAVPQSLREASYGIGARRRATSLRVVVPGAVSGLVAALILSLSRAIGETLVVSIAAGATGGSQFTLNVFGPGQTMTAAMTSLATGSDQVRGQGAAFPSLFFVGMLLFFITLGLNVVSERFVRRVRRRY
ncbi:MAG: phosphate ABC transporter permease subunit PstC [Actinomycetota bacterium]